MDVMTMSDAVNIGGSAVSSAGNSKGAVNLVGNHLEVSFRYSKSRFDQIKQYDGVCYLKERKVWRLPVKHLPALSSSRHFGKRYLSYDFDVESIMKMLSQVKKDRDAARDNIALNPFHVPGDIIAKAECDVVVKLDSANHWVLCFPSPEGKACMSELPGSLLMRNWNSNYGGDRNATEDDVFFLPVTQIKSLVEACKKNKLCFAVEADAGIALQASAKLRHSLIAGGQSGDEKELWDACLVPFISVGRTKADVEVSPNNCEQGDFDVAHGSSGKSSSVTTKQCNTQCSSQYDSQCYTLCYATNEHLRDLLPEIRNYEAKRRKAECLTRQDVLAIVELAAHRKMPVWLTHDVWHGLQQEREAALIALESDKDNFNPAVLQFVTPPLFWHASDVDKPGLYVRESLLKANGGVMQFTGLGGLARELPLNFPGYIMFSVLPSEFLEFYLQAQKALSNVGAVYASSGFQAYLDGVRKRSQLLQKQERYARLEDFPDALVNRALGQRLFPHQRVAVGWLKETDKAFLGDDMGLGKTLSVLATYSELKQLGECEFLLVVCPNSLTNNWLREVVEWVPHLNFTKLPKSKKDREAFLHDLLRYDQYYLDGLVINYESFRMESVFPVLREYMSAKRSMLCLDESQRAKNPDSKTFAALGEVAQIAKRVVLLSGTPTPRELSDIWAQLYLLDQGERLGRNYYRWLEEVAELGNKWSEYAVRKYKPDQVKECVLRVRELLLRRKKEDVVSLPEKVFSTRDVELSGDQLKRYDEVRKELLVTVSSRDGSNVVKPINNILEEFLRAVQIASNPRLVDPSWSGDPAKFVELDDIVREVVEENDGSIVIWSNYLLNVRELVERYRHLGALPFSGEVSTSDRSKHIEAFQSKKKKLLIAVPAAGGVGITLTAAQTAVYMEKTWNGEHWMQSVDRLHRIGQRGTVHIVSLHACKVDQLISGNLNKKVNFQEKLFQNQDDALSNFPTRAELLGALSG